MNKDAQLEFGKDFSFVGEEYRVQDGNKDFFIDLLFYNREHSCLVAIELKVGECMPDVLSGVLLLIPQKSGDASVCTAAWIHKPVIAAVIFSVLCRMPRLMG